MSVNVPWSNKNYDVDETRRPLLMTKFDHWPMWVQITVALPHAILMGLLLMGLVAKDAARVVAMVGMLWLFDHLLPDFCPLILNKGFCVQSPDSSSCA